jgi:hypothetical protein
MLLSETRYWRFGDLPLSSAEEDRPVEQRTTQSLSNDAQMELICASTSDEARLDVSAAN